MISPLPHFAFGGAESACVAVAPEDDVCVCEGVGTSVRFRMDSWIKVSTTALAAVASASDE
jgi:hypothetical protein